MKVGLAYLFASILSLGLIWYFSIDLQNQVTELRMKIPQVTKKLKRIEQENIRLQYEIDAFENPENLLKLARQANYQHLVYPLSNEIVSLKEQMPLQLYAKKSESELSKSKLTLASGANP